MKKTKTTATTILGLALGLACFATLPGCQEEKGPMEKLGEDLDNIAEDAADDLEDAADDLEDAVEDAGKDR